MSNHCRKKIREEKKAKEQAIQEKIQFALSRKVSVRKRNKDQDIQILLTDEKFSFPPKHPLSHFYDWEVNKWRKNKSLRNEVKKVLIKTFNLELMDNEDYVKALIEVTQFKEFWIRPIEDWKVSTHNRDRQFSSLLRWLFVQYDMPLFMDSIWTDLNCQRWKLWYIEIGSGLSAYKVITEEIHLTRKMIHWFMKSPNNFTVKQAIRWAQVLGFGGEEKMAHAITKSRLVTTNYSDFWSSLVHLFARNPMMDTTQVDPIIDYVRNEKNQNPNYSLKGRTIVSLIAQTEEWHNHLNRIKRINKDIWEGIKIPNWKLLQGKKSTEEIEGQLLGKKQTLYTITQILTGKDLAIEGREMRHCVSSYSHSCKSGRTSIWSLKVDKWKSNGRGIYHLLTIQLSNKYKQIQEIRGFCNRMPTVQEKNIIAKWAKKSDIVFNSNGFF